jgi:hypothetical protein
MFLLLPKVAHCRFHGLDDLGIPVESSGKPGGLRVATGPDLALMGRTHVESFCHIRRDAGVDQKSNLGKPPFGRHVFSSFRYFPSGLVQGLAVLPEHVRDGMDPPNDNQRLITEREPREDERCSQSKNDIHQHSAHIGDIHFFPLEPPR